MNTQGIIEINEYIKEYLRHHNMFSTLEKFEEEIKTKQIPAKLRAGNSHGLTKEDPKLHYLFKKTDKKTVRELNLEQDFKEINKKYNLVIQAARQIFSVSINLIQTLLGVRPVRKKIIRKSTFWHFFVIFCQFFSNSSSLIRRLSLLIW